MSARRPCPLAPGRVPPAAILDPSPAPFNKVPLGFMPCRRERHPWRIHLT
jgi:hypothetical protein